MIKMCPYSSYDFLFESWRNYSKNAWNGSGEKFSSYVCRYSGFAEEKISTERLEAHLVLLFSGLGFLGGLLSVLTLSQDKFRILNFRLYLWIGYLEMLQMSIVALMDGLAYTRCDLSYACTLIWAHMGITIMNICADATDLLVLFLSLERTVACLLPHQFPRLHNDQSYAMAVAVSLIVPAVFSLFHAFELTVIHDRAYNSYYTQASQFSQTEFYSYVKRINTLRFYATAIFIAATTGCSIWGFCTVAKRRRKLSNRKKPYSQSSSNHASTQLMMTTNRVPYARSRIDRKKGRSIKRKNRQAELCCLQLCLAVPVVINHVLYATGSQFEMSFPEGEQVIRMAGTDQSIFRDAMSDIERAYAFMYLKSATNVSNVLAHALHFYLYIMFSLKVRQGFFGLLTSKCGKKVTLQRRVSFTSNVETGK